jgi:hypothetical protein
MRSKEPVLWSWRGMLSVLMLYVAAENTAIRKELRALNVSATANAVRLVRIERLLQIEQVNTEKAYGLIPH